MPKAIEVEITPSRMKVLVTVKPELGVIPKGAPVWENLIEAELRSVGVVYGIDRDAIADLVKNQKWGEKIVVAKGADPIPGEHGRIEYLFNMARQAKPKQLEDGKVDYREINLIQVVNKDDLLARLIPPKEGVPGKTVEGRDMPARPGLAAIMQGGLNTYFSDAQKRELRAVTAGSVSLVRGMVQVDSTLALEGHVDFSSGNLAFTGDIIIRGDVKSGFRVKSEGSIEIHGVVEDALVEAGRDVLVKGGFEGSGRGVIRARGKVHVRFIENQTIVAEGSIHVGDMVLHGQIESGEGVYLTSGRGAIIGGRVKARDVVLAKILGNAQHALTIVEVLRDLVTDEDVAKQEAELAAIQQNILNLKNSVDSLQRLKSGDKSQPVGADADMKRSISKMQQLKVAFDQKRLGLEKLQKRLLEKQQTGTVTVTQKAFPGVQIIIGEEIQKIREVSGPTVFKSSELEVETASEVPA